MTDYSDLGFVPASEEKHDDVGFQPSPALTPKVGMLESLGRGAEQGALAGFGDETNAALSTLLDSTLGRNKALGVVDDYKKNREESRAAMDAAHSQHPWIYNTGSVLGSLIPAAATGGGSLAEQGLAGVAKMGGAYGAAAGLGNSTADLTQGQVGQAAKDTAVGGALGAASAPLLQAATAPLIQPAASMLGKVADLGVGAGRTIAGLKPIQMPYDAFKQGLQGNVLMGSIGQKNANNAVIGALGASSEGAETNAFTQLQNLSNAYGAQKTSMLAKAAPLSPNDYMPWVQQAEQAVTNATDATNGTAPGLGTIDALIKKTFYDSVPDAEGNIDFIPKQNMSMLQLENFKSQLGSMGSAEFANGMKDPVAQSLVNRLMSPASRDLNTRETLLNLPQDLVPLTTFMENKIPGLDGVNSKISALSGALQSKPSMSNILQSEKGGVNSIQAQDSINTMLNQLKADPSLADTATKLEGQLKQAGTLSSLVQHANAPGLQHGLIADTVRGSAIAAGNTGGLAVRALYNMTPDALKGLATNMTANAARLGDSAIVSKIANTISQAADRDQVGRNALFFALSQQPAYRDILKKATGEDTEPQK